MWPGIAHRIELWRRLRLADREIRRLCARSLEDIGIEPYEAGCPSGSLHSADGAAKPVPPPPCSRRER